MCALIYFFLLYFIFKNSGREPLDCYQNSLIGYHLYFENHDTNTQLVYLTQLLLEERSTILSKLFLSLQFPHLQNEEAGPDL